MAAMVSFAVGRMLTPMSLVPPTFPFALAGAGPLSAGFINQYLFIVKTLFYIFSLNCFYIEKASYSLFF